MKKRLAITCAAIALALCGCGKMELADPENGFATQYAMSAIEYSNYINKEIATMQNILITRLAVSESILEGEYPWDQEISNTEEAISKTNGIYNGVTTTMPATNYESDREQVLLLLDDARTGLEAYLSALNNKSKTEVETAAAGLKACSLALGGEANVNYQ